MLASQPSAKSTSTLLSPGSKSATAFATGPWVSVSDAEGHLEIVQLVGAITGSVDGKIQHADDGSGTNAADVPGAVFAQVAAQDSTLAINIPAKGLKPFVRYVGTIVTGPVVMSVSMRRHLKYA
jgi:hypothetical protein